MEKQENTLKFVGTKSRSAVKCVSNLLSKAKKCRAALKIHENDTKAYIKQERESSNSKAQKAVEVCLDDTLNRREFLSNSENRISYAAHDVNSAGLECCEIGKMGIEKKELRNENKELKEGIGNRSCLAYSTQHVMDYNEMIEKSPNKRNNILHSTGVLKII